MNEAEENHWNPDYPIREARTEPRISHILSTSAAGSVRKCPFGSLAARSIQNAPDITSFIFCVVLAIPCIPWYRLADDNV
jgi:hypothetical protein